jgi:hypothetical protein
MRHEGRAPSVLDLGTTQMYVMNIFLWLLVVRNLWHQWTESCAPEFSTTLWWDDRICPDDSSCPAIMLITIFTSRGYMFDWTGHRNSQTPPVMTGRISHMSCLVRSVQMTSSSSLHFPTPDVTGGISYCQVKNWLMNPFIRLGRNCWM